MQATLAINAIVYLLYGQTSHAHGMDTGHPGRFDISPLFIAVLGFMSATIILTVYHCIVVGWCSIRSGPGLQQEQEETVSGLENSTVQLIPSYKYTKEAGLVEEGRDGTCAVCLGEFIEGDEVRMLPECAHFFHVPCIDMWLSSHSNCPLCRTDATPSLELMRPPLESI